MTAAGMGRWLRRSVTDFDVVHVHLARDFVTLPAARRALRQDVPIVVQPHGMIDASESLLAKPLDALWTVPTLRRARSVFHLTPRESADLEHVAGAGRLALRPLHNGVPSAPRREPRTDGVQEVLFLARLHQRKRPDMFVKMANALAAEGVDASFTLVGPDEGEGAHIAALIDEYGLAGRVSMEGAVSPEDSGARLARASVYVLPSVDEPYPMSVLEAMAIGLPVVITDSCGLAPLVAESQSGIVVGSDLESLVSAVLRMLRDPDEAANMGENGRRIVETELQMGNVARILEEVYRVACGLP